MADTGDWGFREELEDPLWRPAKLLQQGLLVHFSFFCWVNHVHEFLGGFFEYLQFLLPPSFFLAQRLDLLKAVGELLLSVIDDLLQPLNIICTVIQYILHVSKQLFFVF
jgi:hypothetical protein